jgi:DNA ligase (NAD+)
MTDQELETEVKTLEEAAKYYYNAPDEVTMEDAEYDRRVDYLKANHPEHPLVKPFLQKVGARPLGVVIKHDYPVGSQEKLKTREEFYSWCLNVLAKHKGPKKPFVLQWKLDGGTIVLTYENGRLLRAVTRGTGIEGEDVTENALKMKNVKKNLPGFSGTLRGECLISKSDFERVFKPLGYKNPRNTATGLTRDQKGGSLQKDIIVKYFDLIQNVAKLETEMENINFINGSLVLETVETEEFDNPDTLWAAIKRMEEQRPDYQYEVDGVIVRANSLELQEEMGMSSDLRPRMQRCVKFQAQSAVTQLLGITWSLGHTGAHIPTGNVKPVEIGGVTVSNVLLNNPTYMKELDLEIGDTFLIERAGDVIPHAAKVLDRSGRTGTVVPTVCIACGGPLVTEGAFLLCKNEECEGKAIRRLKNWVSKRSIKFLGDTLIEELWDNHNIKEPQDLYKLTEEFLATVGRGAGVVGSSSVLIMSEINKSKKCSLPDFLGSLCIKFLGRRQVEIVMESAPSVGVKADTLESWLVMKVEDLVKVPGFAADGSKAGAIIEGIKKARPTISGLLSAGVEVKEPVQVETIAGHPFNGKSVCFTGVRMKPSEAERFRAVGAIEKSGVSKGLDFLVAKDTTSSSNKAEKAKALGTEILGWDDFLRILNS